MRAVVAGLVLVALTAPVRAQELLDGEKLFKSQCASCHSAAAGEPNRQGPNLHGIVGKKAGVVPQQVYSEGFVKALTGKVWTPALLDKWLEEPQDVAPDSIMMYKQSDAEKRAALIGYLKTLQAK